MGRYLMTHSLLASWLYMQKGNPYEDMTSERDHLAEFMMTLRREPTPTTEAMLNGIEFEDMVTDITWGGRPVTHRWYEAACKVANVVAGGSLQHKASKLVRIGDMDILLYGRLDCLKAGTIYDIKFSRSYDRGKYITSTQHPMYLELIPEAQEFTYLISNGQEFWTETYRRDETPSIITTAENFLRFLSDSDLMDVYKEHWGAKR